MRTLKTGLAVFVVTLIGSLYDPHNIPLFACFAAILAMQETTEESLSVGKSRLLGTAIAGVLGYFFLRIYAFFPDVLLGRLLLIAIGVVAGLVACNLIGQRKACAICAIILVTLMSSYTQDDLFEYVFIRTLETAMGVVVAVLINRFIFPPPADTAKANSSVSRGESNADAAPSPKAPDEPGLDTGDTEAEGKMPPDIREQQPNSLDK